MQFQRWRHGIAAVTAAVALVSAMPAAAAPAEAGYQVLVEPAYNRATIFGSGVLLGNNDPQAGQLYDGDGLLMWNAAGQISEADGAAGGLSPAASPDSSGAAYEYFADTDLLRVVNAEGKEGLMNREGRLVGGYVDAVKSGGYNYEGILLQQGDQQYVYQADGTLLGQYPASLPLTCRRESGYTIVWEGTDPAGKTPLAVFDPAGQERPELTAYVGFSGKPDGSLFVWDEEHMNLLGKDGEWLLPMETRNVHEITVDGWEYYLVTYGDDTFSIYREDGKVMTARETGVLYPQINWPADYLLLSVGDRFGAYHIARGLLFEPIYEAVEVVSDRYMVALKDGRRQLFDRNGRSLAELGELRFDTACDGQLAFAPASTERVYIDMQTGEWLELSEGARVSLLLERRHGLMTTLYLTSNGPPPNRKLTYGLMTDSGQVLLDTVYDTVLLPERAGQPVIIARDGRYDLWKDGRVLTADRAYTEITAFSGNAAIVKTAAGAGLVDGTGRELAAPGTFRYLQFLQPRLLIGEDASGYCLVDETGRVTARLPYERIGRRSLGDSRSQTVVPLPGSGTGEQEGVYSLLVWDENGKAGVIAVSVLAMAGDINGDGVVNTTDARLALQAAVEKIELSESQRQIADVSGDGTVDTTDARLLLQYAVGKLDHF